MGVNVSVVSDCLHTHRAGPGIRRGTIQGCCARSMCESGDPMG
jgi:hypothetical protein